MSFSSLHADARASAPVPARSAQLERRLARFQLLVQPRVRALADRHPRLADLALSFPALLFALAVPRAGFDPARAISRVIDGAPLRELSTISGVPRWLRRVVPEGFAAPLPVLPDDEFFNRQIANYIPRSPKRVQTWLAAVANAAIWGDAAVSIWIAREAKDRRTELGRLRRVCVWAWYSRHTSLGPGSAAWSIAMKYDAARDAASRWLERLVFQLKAGGDRVGNSWLAPGQFSGFEFSPLDTLDAIKAEGVLMRNCVGGYSNRVLNNQIRLWSVQQNGIPVATLELALPWDGPLPYVAQLKAKSNKAAPLEVWIAARAWLVAQEIERFDPAELNRRRIPIDRALWMACWKPYWLAKRRFPEWLPLGPDSYATTNI